MYKITFFDRVRIVKRTFFFLHLLQKNGLVNGKKIWNNEWLYIEYQQCACRHKNISSYCMAKRDKLQLFGFDCLCHKPARRPLLCLQSSMLQYNLNGKKNYLKKNGITTTLVKSLLLSSSWSSLLLLPLLFSYLFCNYYFFVVQNGISRYQRSKHSISH